MMDVEIIVRAREGKYEREIVLDGFEYKAMFPAAANFAIRDMIDKSRQDVKQHILITSLDAAGKLLDAKPVPSKNRIIHPPIVDCDD